MQMERTYASISTAQRSPGDLHVLVNHISSIVRILNEDMTTGINAKNIILKFGHPFHNQYKECNPRICTTPSINNTRMDGKESLVLDTTTL
uniref:AlNc14C77G5148 protein n=1 Tax=Albugo laibachii Nc14 TaxID=890382 RepID=F0WEU9_9STRA|nr:AlNc14C77G5148 [Albugo laibachii Nc14]|eukprot:CCA19731.1 AlNc14C77G5148 [Albugo laibachii Nc14]